MPMTMTALAHCMKRKKNRTGRRVEMPLPSLNAIVFDVLFYSARTEDVCVYVRSGWWMICVEMLSVTRLTEAW